MLFRFGVSAAFVALSTALSAAFAQTARPDDPDATVPAVQTPSAFAAYRPYREVEIAPWREVNDEMGRIGSGIAHMRAGPTVRPGDTRSPAGAHDVHHGAKGKK